MPCGGFLLLVAIAMATCFSTPNFEGAGGEGRSLAC